MGVLLTYLVVEGVLLYCLNAQKLKEQELLKKWTTGNLSYDDILVLKKSKRFLLRKLNRSVAVGADPGLSKKTN